MPFGYTREKYEQSRKWLEELKQKYKVGNYVQYGHYPQEEGGTDSTPIEWRVIAQEGCKALLISRYGLDKKQYNKTMTGKGVTWETCTLRKWLNEDFMKKAFNPNGRGSILITAVDNSTSQGYPQYDTDGGNNTFDRIFLLSYAEAEKYFEEDEDRRCAATEHAVENGVAAWDEIKVDGKPTCNWWLRSSSDISDCASYVDYDCNGCYVSYVYNDGGPNLQTYCYVDESHYSVRPAFWLNLETADI